MDWPPKIAISLLHILSHGGLKRFYNGDASNHMDLVENWPTERSIVVDLGVIKRAEER